MSAKIESINHIVLDRVSPRAGERKKIEALARKLKVEVASVSRKLKIQAEVRVEGSVAKDTWLSGEGDIDVFMLVSTSIPKDSLGKVCLRVARKATEGLEQMERFAEHPYLEAIVDGTRVNIVPCYDTKRGEWLSATDRTPFHTEYMKKRLDNVMRGQVRLLKKFMKGIGVYGAEIRIGGFSGYLCELLILHYSSFLGTVKAFSGLKQKMVIDIEGFYSGNRRHEIDVLFDEPLVVVDPIDRARNVASAVRKEKLYIFMAAARAFMNSPNLTFFYPSAISALNARKMKQELEKRGSAIVFVTFGEVDAVPDILWGQLYKSIRSLRRLIELNDFALLRDFVWSDEKSLNLFGFELESRLVSSVKRHVGPPLEREPECAKFLLKYTDNSSLVAGPYVEDGRWIVQVRRRFTEACMLLREKLKAGGKDAGVANQISKTIQKSFLVLVNEQILETYERNEEFAKFLTAFLSGRPRWLSQ